MTNHRRKAPKELVDAIEVILRRYQAENEAGPDDIAELRLVLKEVQGSPDPKAMLAAIAEAFRAAGAEALARVVDEHAGTIPERRTADAVGPDDIRDIPLSLEDRQHINVTLAALREIEKESILQKTKQGMDQLKLGSHDAKQAVVNLARGRVTEAVASYSLCLAELRDAWRSLPQEIRSTVKFLTGRAIVATITAKVVSAVQVLASAARGDEDESDPG